MSDYAGGALHQVAPYIGKLRPALARRLVTSYTQEGEWVWDPFCGCGTIPLECRLLGRHVIAGDVNPYASTVTAAKLAAPASADEALCQLERAAHVLATLPRTGAPNAPGWVREFFHDRTLRETIALAGEFKRVRLHFHMGCLLGILHHQRPGFLSYPASHLVPYLRNRRYPRELYPEAYEYRDPLPRLGAKIIRALQNPPSPPQCGSIVLRKSALRKYLPPASVDAVITSPPYMDALDYARDNRLRMWLLGIDDYREIRSREMRRAGTFEADMTAFLAITSDVLRPGGSLVLVVGDVSRPNRLHDVSQIIAVLMERTFPEFRAVDRWVDEMPDARRARRKGRATKRETVFVFRRDE